MITAFLSDTIVKGGVAPLFDNPREYGLEYEDITFKTADGLTLSGWLVKGGTDKIIIQSHFGVQSCRAGFTPEGKGMVKLWKEKIPFLKHVKYLVEKGYSVLMYDFRSHGESQEAKGNWVSWGPQEAQDLSAAVKFVTEHPDYRKAQLGLLSICMGAAATTYAYGAGNLQQYKNIKAMIAIQPMRYLDFVQALGLPGFLQRWVDAENSKRVGFDMGAKSFKEDVKAISIPTLLVQNDQDEYLNRNSIEEYYKSLTVEKEMLWLSDIGKKRAAGYDYLTKNPEKILYWFERHMA
ncbi:MAG: alpha/beta hydrolase [Saprospiraceae bacterium]|nr:alpha/beta hydrolase [Saprospiraceae bacterium]